MPLFPTVETEGRVGRLLALDLTPIKPARLTLPYLTLAKNRGSLISAKPYRAKALAD